MFYGLAGIAAAWQLFVDTINQALPQHWWNLQGIIGQLTGQGAAGASPLQSGPAPSYVIPQPTASQWLQGIGPQLLSWPAAGSGSLPTVPIPSVPLGGGGFVPMGPTQLL